MFLLHRSCKSRLTRLPCRVSSRNGLFGMFAVGSHGCKSIRGCVFNKKKAQLDKQECHSFWVESSCLDTCPMYVSLPERQKYMLDKLRCRFPETCSSGPKRCVRLDQSKSICVYNGVSTVTPKGDFWVCWKGRKLLPQDFLATQGIYVPAQTLAKFPNDLLKSLGGNSFCSVSCTKHILTLLVFYGAVMRQQAQNNSCATACASAPRADAAATTWQQAAQVSEQKPVQPQGHRPPMARGDSTDWTVFSD